MADALLDSYDPGRSNDEINAVYSKLKKELPLMIAQIAEKQKSEKVIPIDQPIAIEAQEKVCRRIMKDMGFDMNKGMLASSTHPFCAGSPDDVRMTTRFDEGNLMFSTYATIHETGHGLYQQNLPKKHRYQPIGNHMGMSFHESQSLFMESQASLSTEYCQHFAKILRDEGGLKGDEFSAENLYKLLTRVRPSFIRVEADEVTYPLHVILRHEIEQEIIYNDLKAKELPALWNSKMQEYLGITPASDSEGCLQDIHWPSGIIGYFPSYTNGAIIASMLMRRIKKETPDVMGNLCQGNFSVFNDYLNKNFRGHGCSLSSAKLLKSSTGESEISADIFLEYLREKYLV